MPVTAEQFKAYKKQDGLLDHVMHPGSKKYQALMEDFDWSVAELIPELYQVYNDLLADDYKNRVLRKLDKLDCAPGVK
jgi:hypothetical protein